VRGVSAQEHGPPRVLVLYDDDCGFCRWSLAALLRRDRHRLVIAPIQSAEAQALLDEAEVPVADRLRAAHAVPLDGPPAALRSGGDAVPLVLGTVGLGLAGRLAPPLLRRLVYGAIAGNRTLLGRGVGTQRRADADRVIAQRRAEAPWPGVGAARP
jgi:predicted DCC family thiol-disulfide oxidoreductase YuxK